MAAPLVSDELWSLARPISILRLRACRTTSPKLPLCRRRRALRLHRRHAIAGIRPPRENRHATEGAAVRPQRRHLALRAGVGCRRLLATRKGREQRTDERDIDEPFGCSNA